MAVNPALGFDPATDTGSLGLVSRIVGADKLWAKGYTGKGVDVAVIDTGVSPVPGLASGNLVNGPDLSFDSQRADLQYRDAYGHGTHMAGIIAGRDVAGTPSTYTTTNARFTGIAPDARIINVKVGAADGAADVSQVIAAINWVTENRARNGLNIRVLNLSYGTDSLQDYRLDPLSYAAEVAWRKGIVVVVAAGNDGTTKVELANPALNPNLLAVGASDPMGTLPTSDDRLPDFSNRGTERRYVDVVAPGRSVLGLRVPGGAIDTQFPASRIGTRFTRGSGTSQATAVASGAAALLLSAHPTLTPSQVKGALVKTAVISPVGTPKRMGAGIINASLAHTAIAMTGATPHASSAFGTGTGSLQLARGSVRLGDNGVVLSGERDIFGKPWMPSIWAPAALAGTTWNNGSWNGSAWTGTTWASTGYWQGRAWVGKTWSGSAWSGRAWVGNVWTGRRWVGNTWAGGLWS
jgi:serine protease AprX